MSRLSTTSTPGTAIYYEDFGGHGQPVVLIHGWPLSHRMWEAQITALRDAGYRCIAYDRRGFGASDHPTEGYDYDTFAEDLNDLVRSLALKDAVLVGFSMGGGEVVRYLSRHGEDGRVAKAMLVGAVPPFLLETPDNPHAVPGSVFDDMLAAVKRDRIGFLEQFLVNFFNLDADNVELGADALAYVKSIAWTASPLATQQCITAFGTTDFRQDLAAIQVPTLVVHGDADRIVPIDVSARRAVQQIAGSRLEVISGAPHGLTATHGDTLTRLMLDFLAS